MKRAERANVFERLQTLSAESPRILLATGKLIGEGFDHAPLDTLILAMPISWKGTLQQYVGRLHREHASKSDILVIDFIDRSHPSLARMWNKRQVGYKAMGYEVQRLNRGLNVEACAVTDNESVKQERGKPNQEDTLKGSSKGQSKLNI